MLVENVKKKDRKKADMPNIISKKRLKISLFFGKIYHHILGLDVLNHREEIHNGRKRRD